MNRPLTLARHTSQETVHLRLGKATVTTRRTDAVDPSRGSPTGDSLGIDPEDRGDLSGRHQTVLCIHPIPQQVGPSDNIECCPGHE